MDMRLNQLNWMIPMGHQRTSAETYTLQTITITRSAKSTVHALLARLQEREHMEVVGMDLRLN